MHFGASKGQVTLHTGMVYLHEMSQSFCTISHNNMHQPPAIWAHLLPVLKMIRDKFQVTIIHFFTDGPTSQYRQKNNFYLIDLFTQTLELEYVTWSFFESGHDKGVADGIGGSVKRALDRQVCFGKDIRDASDAYHILKACMKTVKVWLIEDKVINNIVSMIPNNITTLVGTMQIYQVITKGDGILYYRDISCFCSELNGVCSCFGLKTPCVRSITEIKDILQPVTSNFPDNEVSSPKITARTLDLPIEDVSSDITPATRLLNEVDTMGIASENLNLPFDADLDLIDVNLMPIHILPDPKSNSPEIIKTVDVLPDNTYKPYYPVPNSTKHDILSSKKEDKRVPKKNYKE
ncbi:uncharacterized protein LOC124541567 [Vanessa cardui]|uniref:uncharacterized protein LOC124541567 n=1 Tax=Vanessa cardui TaxID=171605 RepID=UPI001F13D9E7|nr:uncharacterized protein LOC124541567 [Vanessa cardui]